jgi:hypothetical protein
MRHGPAAGEEPTTPATRRIRSNAGCIALWLRRVPRLETNTQTGSAVGRSSSRRARYACSAASVLSWTSTSRDLPYLLSRIRSSRSVASMSALSNANASPTRSPVQASSPISVSIVTALSVGRNVLAAAISAAISCLV